MSSEFDNVDLNSLTSAQLATIKLTVDEELQQLDLELKREQVAAIKARKNARRDEAHSKSIAILQFLAQRKANQCSCNHRKGGMGANAVLRGEGTSAMYAVIKHLKPNGKWMVLCTRCGAEWHQGFPLLGEKETPGFREAINWPSDSTPSRSAYFTYGRTEVQENDEAAVANDRQ